MQKVLAVELRKEAEKWADIFSNRSNRQVNETFTVEKLMVLSESTGAIIFTKSGGKKAMMFSYWIWRRNDDKYPAGGYWTSFFVSDSHILGMQSVAPILHEIEQHNFKYNFDDIEEHNISNEKQVEFEAEAEAMAEGLIV